MKNIYFIILALFSILYVILEVRNGKFSIKESFYWFVASLIMLILAIFPKILDGVADRLNIYYAPSLLFVLCIVFLLFINFRSSKKIAEQQEKINALAQEVSILRSKYEKR